MTLHQGEPEDQDSFDVSRSDLAPHVWTSISDLAPRARHEARLLGDLLSHDEHAAFVRSLDDDPDLATT
ncbi:hypothetical protein [Candidatus Poriferisodalis sp.]|uniref:hypothetical protein n=1 Tax=Candidatus Poriferisodalis sp. TaxID=3101277 RepID=UPI003B020139